MSTQHQTARQGAPLVASVGLIDAPNFVRAIRDSGYLNLATALAELIDNSLQAGADVIDITIDREGSDGLHRIAVEDNGMGMSTDELVACLRFGGSSRFDSRNSFGRFGMGLPAASLSQARHVEVATWRPGGAAQSVSLDVDVVASGLDANLEPVPASSGRAASGCRVIWRACDRIEYRRLGWLERYLHKELGRIFRRFLGKGVRLTINGVTVQAVDPMLLATEVNGASAEVAFEPLEYEIHTPTGATSIVRVTFSVLPVSRWHRLDNSTKRLLGVVGNGGVSILRAGREIACGWYLMGGKRKENYDDWWRCEVEFDPTLDEQFGITVNKQGVRPTSALREALEPELESIGRLLNGRVRQAFEEVKFEAAVLGSCQMAGDADADLPIIRTAGGAAGALSYHLGAEQLSGDFMFDLTLKQRQLKVTMNIDHPGFAALYRPLHDMGESGASIRTALELFFLSFARSVAATAASESEYRELLQQWGLSYGRMLKRL